MAVDDESLRQFLHGLNQRLAALVADESAVAGFDVAFSLVLGRRGGGPADMILWPPDDRGQRRMLEAALRRLDEHERTGGGRLH